MKYLQRLRTKLFFDHTAAQPKLLRSMKNLHALSNKLSPTVKSIRYWLALKWHGWTVFFVWLLGLIILHVLVCKQFFPLLDDYYNRNIGTHVFVRHEKASHRNRTYVRLPKVTLCVPRSFSTTLDAVHQLANSLEGKATCEICNQMQNHSWPFGANFTIASGKNMKTHDAVRAYQNSTLIPLINKLAFDTGDDFDYLRLENLSWNQLIIDAVWDVLSCVFTYDRHEFVSSPNVDWCLHNTKLIDSFLVDKRRIENLFGRFADIICNFVLYSDLKEGKNRWPSSICKQSFNEKHASIFYNNLCFGLPINSSSLSTVVDEYGHNASWNALDGKAFLPSKYVPHISVFYHTGSLFTPRYLKGYHSLYQSLESAESVSIQYTIPFTVLEQREHVSCYMHMTQSGCKNRCVVNEVVKSCKCVPFTLRRYINNTIRASTPYCTTAHYHKCKFNIYAKQAMCDHHCINPCEYIPYQWMVTRSPLSINPRRRLFALTIKQVGSVQVDFHTTEKTSPEVLLAQLGSIVNFYLGFSGLTIISGVVYFVNLLKQLISRRRATDEKKKTKKLRHISFGTRDRIGSRLIYQLKRINRFMDIQEKINENVHATLDGVQTQLTEIKRCQFRY